MFELLYQILHQNWRYFFKTSVLTSVQRGATEDTMENEAQFTAAMQVSGHKLFNIKTIYAFIFEFLFCLVTFQDSNCSYHIIKVVNSSTVKIYVKSISSYCYSDVYSRLLDSLSCSRTSTSSSRISYIWSRSTASTSCITE